MTTQNPPCRVLVIDSCPETQAGIVRLVHGRGIAVTAVPDPITAVTAIDQVAPDVIITDLFLPAGAGLALTKEIGSRRELCPVIVMASDAPESVIVQALRAGAVDYLHKPIVEEELAHALYRARHMLPGDLADLSGVRRSECRLAIDSDPAHIPGILSWLMKTTASTLPDTQRLHLRGALQELLINAVEHGNLEIAYREKQQALAKGEYELLLEERLAQPRIRSRQVIVHVLYEREAKRVGYRITDEGAGFPWRGLLNQSEEAISTEGGSGRGIFLTRSLFPNLTYNDRGNEATITVPLG
ncbi:MAG: response regulator [Nitrospira sp.]|nr:response regulator [Nitrospira sp.]